MAKEKEKKALKRGRASFNLIGRVKLTDRTFNLNNTYDSGWTDNGMYVGIDCGEGNLVYAEMKSGFFPDRDNTIYAYSKDEKDEKGMSKSVQIAWEDRFDESLLDTISDSSFLTVGVEKDVKEKTVYKKFLTAYDAVEYLNEHLVDGMVVNVRGNLKYSQYEENVSVRKEITSIALSKAEEDSYKATFTQTLLVGKKAFGKPDKEKNVIPFDAFIVDYVGNVKVDGEKVAIKKNISFPKSFELNNEDAELSAKLIKKFFDPKKGYYNEVTVAGKFIEGGSVVTITDDDIPDDIKELIEMGAYSEEEAKSKMAVGNNNREKRMVVIKPEIVYVGDGDDRKPTIAFDPDKYEDDDLVFYEQSLVEAMGSDDSSDEVPFDETSNDDSDEDDELMKMLENM